MNHAPFRQGPYWTFPVMVTLALLSCSNETVLDTTKTTVGYALTRELRNDMFSIVHADFREFVRERRELPDSVEQLQDYHGSRTSVLTDPLPFSEFLIYLPITNRFGIVYSIGYDGIDDKASQIYDTQFDSVMLQLHGQVLEAFHQGMPYSDIQDFNLIRGDLVLALFVVDEPSPDSTFLSVTWINPARNWYSKSIMENLVR